MNDPISNVQTIWASEVRFCIRNDNKEKFPTILYLKDAKTNDEYRIKADMNLVQVKEYYKIFKYIIEQAECEGDIND